MLKALFSISFFSFFFSRWKKCFQPKCLRFASPTFFIVVIFFIESCLFSFFTWIFCVWLVSRASFPLSDSPTAIVEVASSIASNLGWFRRTYSFFFFNAKIRFSFPESSRFSSRSCFFLARWNDNSNQCRESVQSRSVGKSIFWRKSGHWTKLSNGNGCNRTTQSKRNDFWIVKTSERSVANHFIIRSCMFTFFIKTTCKVN